MYAQMHTEYFEECHTVQDNEVLHSGVLLLCRLVVSHTCLYLRRGSSAWERYTWETVRSTTHHIVIHYCTDSFLFTRACFWRYVIRVLLIYPTPPSARIQHVEAKAS